MPANPATKVAPLMIALVMLPASAALAHLGANPKSLRMLIAEADLVVIGKVIAPDRIYRRPDRGFQQPFIEIKVLEEIKGQSAEVYIDFFGHGHGIARYRAGDEALFFLKEMLKNPVWRKSDLADRFTYYSDQEVQHRFILTDDNRAIWTDAARRYIRAYEMEPGPKRGKVLRDITIDLLGGPEEKLAMLAVYDLMFVPNVYQVFSPEQIQKLKKIADRSGVNMRLRILLLHKLAADPGFPLYDKIVALFVQAQQPVDKVSIIRALARCGDKRVIEFVRPLLGSEDRTIQRASIDALGQPGFDAAVPLLTGMLAETTPSRLAALTRALGRVNTKQAVAELKRLSRNHPNKSVRRYAGAELRRKDRPATSTSAPASRPASAPAALP